MPSPKNYAPNRRFGKWIALKIKVGVLTLAEDVMTDYQYTPLDDHVTVYIAHLEARGATARHCAERRRYVEGLFDACGFRQLREFDRVIVERWLLARTKEGMGARTRNLFHSSLVGFCNWAVANGRLLANPFDAVPVANERADRRRERRALTDEEFRRLLEAARQWPLLERLTKNRGPAVLSESTCDIGLRSFGMSDH